MWGNDVFRQEFYSSFVECQGMAEETDVLSRLGARVFFTSKKTYGRDGVPVYVISMNLLICMRKKLTIHQQNVCSLRDRMTL
jgi:hypothetical protein